MIRLKLFRITSRAAISQKYNYREPNELAHFTGASDKKTAQMPINTWFFEHFQRTAIKFVSQHSFNLQFSSCLLLKSFCFSILMLQTNKAAMFLKDCKSNKQRNIIFILNSSVYIIIIFYFLHYSAVFRLHCCLIRLLTGKFSGKLSWSVIVM